MFCAYIFRSSTALLAGCKLHSEHNQRYQSHSNSFAAIFPTTGIIVHIYLDYSNPYKKTFKSLPLDVNTEAHIHIYIQPTSTCRREVHRTWMERLTMGDGLLVVRCDERLIRRDVLTAQLTGEIVTGNGIHISQDILELQFLAYTVEDPQTVRSC